MLSPHCQPRVTAIFNRSTLFRGIALAASTSLCLALGGLEAGAAAAPDSAPLGLPALEELASDDRIALGARLFFDPLLSVDGSMACSSCHLPDQAFTQNSVKTPMGRDGLPLSRNAPTLLNVAHRQRLFHDGRESDLARQAFSPLTAENEMGNRDLADVITRLAALPHYRRAFSSAFGDGLNEKNLGLALADYQRSLLSANAPFDRWYYGGDADAMSDTAKAGFFVFSAVGCGDCHRFGHEFAHFTDDELHRTGIVGADTGLEAVTGKPADRFRFRTPTLRNVALTPPYMHDGSLATLPDVVTFYNTGGGTIDGNPALAPLGLSGEDQQALVAFLESLNGSN